MKGTILGAIAGDCIGSIYEFNPTKDYNFPLLDSRMEITDDSIITIAVADWVLSDPSHSTEILAQKMRYWGHKYRYPMGAYGTMFSAWLDDPNMGPYNSWGNGSAMRVSPVAFALDNLEDVLRVAKKSAEVTHNHPDGIKGAQITAACIFLAKEGKSKDEIREFLSSHTKYDFTKTCDDIRPTYSFEGSCQETVPQSIIAFLDSKDFEDAIRLTVSLGGDADTMGAITGAIAAAAYEIPDEIANFVLERIPEDLKKVVTAFEEKFTL